jgi:glycosyltransferase involved in cell wall biosynthesis
MPIVVYAHDGESLYDFFFLEHLVKGNAVCLLTFNAKPAPIPKGVKVQRMREPFHPMVSPLAGLNTYLGSFLRALILRFHLNRIKHDVLIGCGGLSYGFYSALSNGAHYVLFIWGSDVQVAPRWLPFRFISKYSLKKASAVVVDSKVQEEACVKLGCNPEKIVRFPWIDTAPVVMQLNNAGFHLRTESFFGQKQEWHENDPIIISTRNHEPIYNVNCLIDAIPLILKEVENARFLILGKGSLTEKLKRKVEALGVKDHVAFMGWVHRDDLLQYLKMSAIYVSTSLSDGTSASLLEAMTCKLPPIATDIPGNREWIIDGVNGLLFPVEDSQTLAQEIVKLLGDKDSRNLLGTKAYETVIEKADWRRNSRLLDNLISSMAKLK